MITHFFQSNQYLHYNDLLLQLNIPAFGFSPLINTEQRLHSHDEYLNARTYLNGIEIYKNIIFRLGNA